MRFYSSPFQRNKSEDPQTLEVSVYDGSSSSSKVPFEMEGYTTLFDIPVALTPVELTVI